MPPPMRSVFCPGPKPRYPQQRRGCAAKTSTKLQSLTTFSYRQTRETRYYEGNYHNTMGADLYIEYNQQSPIGLQFQARRDQQLFVYDGQRTLRLDNEAMTIDTATARTAQQLEGNSYLFHSWPCCAVTCPPSSAMTGSRKHLAIPSLPITITIV